MVSLLSTSIQNLMNQVGCSSQEIFAYLVMAVIQKNITTINGYVKSQNYPNESELFRIVHPHLDKYSKHIDSNNIFLRPRANSEKGRETIRICQLNRMDLLIKRAKRNSQSKKAMIDFNIDQLCSSYSTNEERKQAAIFIQDLIERAKHLKNIKKAN